MKTILIDDDVKLIFWDGEIIQIPAHILKDIIKNYIKSNEERGQHIKYFTSDDTRS